MIKAKEVRIVKEVKGVMACDVSPVAMFTFEILSNDPVKSVCNVKMIQGTPGQCVEKQ